MVCSYGGAMVFKTHHEHENLYFPGFSRSEYGPRQQNYSTSSSPFPQDSRAQVVASTNFSRAQTPYTYIRSTHLLELGVVGRRPQLAELELRGIGGDLYLRDIDSEGVHSEVTHVIYIHTYIHTYI